MDGFTGCKAAAVKQLPDVTAVMDPFHVVALGFLKALDSHVPRRAFHPTPPLCEEPL